MNRVQLSCDAFVVLRISCWVIKWSLLIQKIVGCLFNLFHEFVKCFRCFALPPTAQGQRMDTQKFTSLARISFQFQPKYSAGRESKVWHGWHGMTATCQDPKTSTLPRNTIYEGNLQAVWKLGEHPEVLATVQVRLAQNVKLIVRSIVCYYCTVTTLTRNNGNMCILYAVVIGVWSIQIFPAWSRRTIVDTVLKWHNDRAVSYWCVPVASDQRTCTLLDPGAAYGARDARKSFFLPAKICPLKSMMGCQEFGSLPYDSDTVPWTKNRDQRCRLQLAVPVTFALKLSLKWWFQRFSDCRVARCCLPHVAPYHKQHI